MAEKRKGLGRGLGALFPEEQKEGKSRAIDVFFSSPLKEVEETPSDLHEHQDLEIHVPISSAEASLEADAGKGADDAAPNTNVPGAKKAQPSKKRGAQGMTRDDDLELVPVPGATFGEVRISDIIPNQRQPREIFDEDELQELADSISEVGVLQPIVIRPLDESVPEFGDAQYELIMGERRWRASQRAGKETIPAIIRRTDDSDLLRDALLENLHRSNLNALEEAAAYQQLLDDFQCTQEELSKRIARSRPQISNTLRLLKLPPLVQRRVAAGVLSAGHARALLGLQDPAAMERLAQRIVAESLSVRQVEEIVAIGDDSAPTRAGGTRRGRHEEELNELAGRLADRFNTRVKVNLGVTKGRIAIEFATIEDLNRILDNLNEENVQIHDETA